MRRYNIVKASDEISDLNFMTDSKHGKWISYDDYITEKVSNDAYSLLAEVRAMKRSCGLNDALDIGYNRAIDDILKKISEHFS